MRSARRSLPSRIPSLPVRAFSSVGKAGIGSEFVTSAFCSFFVDLFSFVVRRRRAERAHRRCGHPKGPVRSLALALFWLLLIRSCVCRLSLTAHPFAAQSLWSLRLLLPTAAAPSQ